MLLVWYLGLVLKPSERQWAWHLCPPVLQLTARMTSLMGRVLSAYGFPQWVPQASAFSIFWGLCYNLTRHPHSSTHSPVRSSCYATGPLRLSGTWNQASGDTLTPAVVCLQSKRCPDSARICGQLRMQPGPLEPQTQWFLSPWLAESWKLFPWWPRLAEMPWSSLC